MRLAMALLVLSASFAHALSTSTSEAGDCGAGVNKHCTGSSFGPCCSQHGYWFVSSLSSPPIHPSSLPSPSNPTPN